MTSTGLFERNHVGGWTPVTRDPSPDEPQLPPPIPPLADVRERLTILTGAWRDLPRHQGMGRDDFLVWAAMLTRRDPDELAKLSAWTAEMIRVCENHLVEEWSIPF